MHTLSVCMTQQAMAKDQKVDNKNENFEMAKKDVLV